MNCPIETQETSELLLAYCARRLDVEVAARIERHIAACPVCRERFDAQRKVWAALDEWEAGAVPVDFDRRLYARIDREAAVPWWRRFSAPLRPMLMHRGLPIAAAACLVVMAGLIMERREMPAPPVEVRVEAVQPDQVERALEDMELLHSFQADLHAQQPSAM